MDNNNNKNITIIPFVSYYNIDISKAIILKANARKSGIYRWNNLITGKSYVGSSINLASRLSIYYSEKAMLSKLNTRISIIYSAILKHGYANFSLDILEYCEIDVLIKREQYYVDLLNPEYNILKVANSKLGSKHSEKTKVKMSVNNTGINHPFYGKRHTYEARRSIGLSLKTIIRTNYIPKPVKAETRLKLSLRSHGVSVKIFDSSKKLVKEFPTITSTAEYFGVSNRTISRYLNNNNSYNGYTFISKFKDN